MSHHGTYAQYQKHRKAGEPPCEPCLIAAREYMKGYRRKNVDQPLVAAIQAEGFAEGVKAVRDAVAAPNLHDDSCCSFGCTLMHSSGWENTRRIRIALGYDPDDGPPPPYRCDGTCNCVVAPFLAAIDALKEGK